MTDASHLWLPKRKIIEPNRELCMRTGMQGYFRIVAGRRDGRSRVLADWFPNLITTAGLNLIGTSASWLSNCKVGSGNTTPNVLDTALQTQIASTGSLISTTGTAQSTAPYYGSRTNTYRFGEGVAAGNLAEVGVSGASGSLFSRALILDGGGSPTTITVLSDEFLDVTYQLRIYPPLVDVTDTITVSGSDYDVIMRAASVTTAGSWAVQNQGDIGGGNSVIAYDGTIGAITADPSGSQSGMLSLANATYGNNDLYRDFTAIFGLLNGNLAGGIQSMLLFLGSASVSLGRLQIHFDPPIPKDNTQVLSLSFRHSWARKTL